MIALLAGVCLLQAPDLAADKRLNALVSYSTTGEQLSKALTGVAKSSGLSLSVAHPFDEDIVALRLSSAPLRDFMTRLSSRLKLSWRATDQGYTLYQTSERAKEAAKELDFERINRLRGLRAEHLSRFRLPRPDFDQAEALLNAETAEPMPDINKEMELYLERGEKIQKLQRNADPTTWIASAVFAHLSDGQYRTLQDDGAITFSTKPNRLQQPIPKAAIDDIKAWASRKSVEDFEVSIQVRMVDPHQLMAYVNLRREGRFVDREGHFIDFQAGALPVNSTEPSGSPLDKTLQIDGFLGLGWRRQSSRQPSKKAMESLLEAIQHPEKREICAAAAGEALVEIAEKTGHQLIAFLSDDVIEKGSRAELPTNGRNMLAAFCDETRSEYAEGAGWLTVVPRELSLARAKRFPRKYFSEVANLTKGGAVLGLNDLARIVSGCSDLQLDGGFFRDYLNDATDQSQDTVCDTYSNIASLRVWNSLGSSEVNVLSQEKAIPIGSLDAASRSLLWRACMLGKNSRIYAGSLVFGDTFRNPQGDDPTVLYPNGFPANEPLEMQLGSQDIVLSAFSGGGPITQWLSLPIDQFAEMSKHNTVDMEKVRIGKTELIRLVVDRVTWSASFRSDEYDYSAPMIPWSKAPEALRKQFDYVRSRGGGGSKN